MDDDDIVYVLLLIVFIGIGDIVRRIDDSRLKQNITTAIGIIAVFLVSGFHIIHCLVEAVINGIIISFVPSKYCHGASFVFSFSYLLFYRCISSFGLPIPPNHTNAIQMLLTLKMVGLALERHETTKMKEQLEKKNHDGGLDAEKAVTLSLKYQGIEPTFMDVFHYSFCYVGILTGPYFKYRTYWDMIHSNDSKVTHIKHALRRLKLLPIYACLFIISSHYFPLSYAKSEEIFQERSLFYRLWYMTPLFFTFRMRFYTGFILSEVACITAGLGAYPVDSLPKPGQGPTAFQHLEGDKSGVEYNFETVHNIDEYAAEFYDVRGSLKSWNMTVQWWLAVNVHRRFPLKALRTVVTMLVSAFWHGVHSGYYLSMLTVPFILMAEDMAKKSFRTMSPKVFDAIAGFAKIQWFSYMGVAFSLLAMDATLNYWKSIYFVGHLMILVIYCSSHMLLMVKKTKKEEPKQH